MNSVEIIKQLGINAKKAAAELANIHNEHKNKARILLRMLYDANRINATNR